MGTHFIYVALCKDHTLYTGYTTNVEKRIIAHNNGTGAKYTKQDDPLHYYMPKNMLQNPKR